MLKKFHNFKKITECRLCNSKKIKQIHNFGLIPIGNNLLKSKLGSINSKKFPLTLMNCLVCNHFQLSISIDPKILYAKNYTYLTGVTKTFKEHDGEGWCHAQIWLILHDKYPFARSCHRLR